MNNKETYYRKKILLFVGLKDGINVRTISDGYIVQMPDRYPLQHALIGKNKIGRLLGKIEPLDETQKPKDVLIFIAKDKIVNAHNLSEFSKAIFDARKTNIEIQCEIVQQDFYQNVWKMNGIPYVKVAIPKAEQNKTIALNGEIISVGKYFVSIKIVEDIDITRVAIIPTHRILKFADGDFRNNVDTAERVKQKLGLTNKDFDNGDINDGIKKTFIFDQKGNCTMVHAIGKKDVLKQSTPTDVKKPFKSPEITIN